LATILVVGLAGTLLSQTAGQPKGSTKAGTVEHIKVHGKALEGNLEGDSPDRDVFIYLPPSYATSKNQRYPVVYLLHGYGLTAERWMPFAKLQDNSDKDIAAGTMKEMILVSPDAFTKYNGSMYSASVTTGDWESFIADDLVAYVDSHYRTIPNRMSRGLGGHSMGGYGTIRIGMKRPDVFSNLYIMSACCLQNNPGGGGNRGAAPAAAAAGDGNRGAAPAPAATTAVPPAPGVPAAATPGAIAPAAATPGAAAPAVATNAVTGANAAAGNRGAGNRGGQGNRGQGNGGQAAGGRGGRGGRGGGFGNTQAAFAAAWSPNPKNPPDYSDLPTKDGQPQPSVVAKWQANSPLTMIDQYVTNLKKYHAIMGDVGTQDGLAGQNRHLDQVMTDFGISHVFETYEGDHTNRVPQRFEEKVLPFFSNNLVFTAPKK
jgi:enterochelin esterase-like enzyme